MKKNNEKKKHKKIEVPIPFIIVTVIFVVGCFAFRSHLLSKLIFGTGKLDKTQLAVSMNSVIDFDKDTGKGNFYITNPKNNLYNEVVKIYLEDDNELIYTSKTLKPGDSIKYDKLSKDLNKGKYNAIAYFEAYNDKGVYYGKSGLKIILRVYK